MKISNYSKNKAESGQIVLILVLMTIVGVTIGLSLVSRTVQDVRISSQIEQSSRAFSAAEAGVENALKSSIADGSIHNGTINVGGASSSYQSKVETIGGGGSTLVTFGNTEENQSQTIWLVDHTPDGDLIETAYFPLGQSLNICWKNVSGVPAVVITLYYKDGANYYVVKQAYDPLNTRGNSFKFAPSGTCGVGGYNYQVTVSPSTVSGSDFQVLSATSIPLFIKIQMLYAGSPIVAQSNFFPPQGKQITSVGQTAAGVVRRIQVIQGFKTLPSLLDFALYSQ